MLNINELESRWLRYKVKSLLPFLIIFLIILISFYLIFNVYFMNSPSQKEIVKIIPKEEKVTQNIQEKIILKTKNPIPVLKKEVLKKEKIIIKPSLSFIENMRMNSPQYYDNEQLKNKKSKPKIKNKKNPTEVRKVPIAQTVKVEIVAESLVNIKRENTQDDIQHVVKRFKKSNNPALSLFIAKKYYELKDYNQAYNYALITNGINKEIEESWIIFSKSLVKLGKKDRAIKILNSYIQNTHSQRAKLLLDNIKSGKVK